MKLPQDAEIAHAQERVDYRKGDILLFDKVECPLVLRGVLIK